MKNHIIAILYNNQQYVGHYQFAACPSQNDIIALSHLEGPKLITTSFTVLNVVHLPIQMGLERTNNRDSDENGIPSIHIHVKKRYN